MLNASDLMEFEILEHDEARSVFRSPRPSETLDELQQVAVRERVLKEMGDYSPGHPFRFENHTPEFIMDDLRSRPVQAVSQPVDFGSAFSRDDIRSHPARAIPATTDFNADFADELNEAHNVWRKQAESDQDEIERTEEVRASNKVEAGYTDVEGGYTVVQGGRTNNGSF